MRLGSTTLAAGIVGYFQILITWYVLGNEEVLLRLAPVTVAAIFVAEAFAAIRVPHDSAGGMRSFQWSGVTALLSLSAFCYVAALATSRGQEPLGSPPRIMEWAVTIVIMFGLAAVHGFISRRFT